jgi:hypothetical protein
MEELSLVYPANDDTKEFTLFGGVAPRLRKLTLDGIRLAWLPSLFGNLRYLDYTHRGPVRGTQAVYQVLSMLQISNRIEELRLSFPWLGETLSAPIRTNRRVVLPKLISLYLRIEGPDIAPELYHLMAHITTPALTALHLLNAHRSQRQFLRLNSFFRVFRLPLCLRYLRIEHGWFDPRVLPQLLGVLGNLRRVVTVGADIPDPYFAGFIIRRRKGNLFILDRST